MLWNFILDLLIILSASHSCCLVPTEFEDSLLRACFQVLTDWVSSCYFTWEYIAGFWLVSRVSFQTMAETPPCSTVAVSGLLESLMSCGESFFVLRRFRDTKFIGLGFVIAEPSLEVPSWLLFWHGSSVWEKRLQENIEKCTIFNKRKRWFHPSGVKLHLVNMSVSWLLMSTYVIWILGSNLILSHNQPKATLWVLDTCLIVGLLHLICILITTSLSSKINTWDSSLWRMCVCWNIVHMRQFINMVPCCRWSVICWTQLFNRYIP